MINRLDVLRDLDEKQFKQQYIINFLASYMATHYEEDCMNGHVAKRDKHQPIEDAAFCAECAWDSIQKHIE